MEINLEIQLIYKFEYYTKLSYDSKSKGGGVT